MYETAILTIHSLVRWVVIALTLVGMLWYALTWRGVLNNSNTDRVLMLLITTAIDVQLVLGLIHFVESLGVPNLVQRSHLEHLGLTLLAVASIHIVSARFRRAEPRLRARSYFLGIVATLLLIVIGVSLLPGNRWALVFAG